MVDIRKLISETCMMWLVKCHTCCHPWRIE